MPPLAITRVVNACALLQLGGDYVLTDPYFRELLDWAPRMREPFGLGVAELPRLSAIIGGHSAFDHWHMASLAGYPHKDATKVYGASEGMVRRARAAGFRHAEHLRWGATRTIGEHLRLEVVSAQKSGGALANNYVLSSGDLRVFVGTEACAMEPLRQYRVNNPPVQVALLPIDDSRLFGNKLVMNGREAVMAARILGAQALFPIHYSLRPVPVIFQTPWSGEDLRFFAAAAPDLEIACMKTGETWRYAPRPSASAA